MKVCVLAIVIKQFNVFDTISVSKCQSMWKNVKIIDIFSAFKKNVAKERNIEIISTTCQWPRYYHLEIFASQIALLKHFTFMAREFKQVFIKICLILHLFSTSKASSFIKFANVVSAIVNTTMHLYPMSMLVNSTNNTFSQIYYWNKKPGHYDAEIGNLYGITKHELNP